MNKMFHITFSFPRLSLLEMLAFLRSHQNTAPTFMRHGHMNHQQTTRLVADNDGSAVSDFNLEFMKKKYMNGNFANFGNSGKFNNLTILTIAKIIYRQKCNAKTL